MPNRDVHVLTSGAAGLLFTAHQRREQPEAAQIIELLGGLGGGYVGGRLPDILEPAIHPRHRGRAHSFTVVGGLLKVSQTELEQWQATCRRWADGFAVKRAACPPGSLEALFLSLAEILCRALAGFLAGLLAGYITHLALDMRTPFCLNII